MQTYDASGSNMSMLWKLQIIPGNDQLSFPIPVCRSAGSFLLSHLQTYLAFTEPAKGSIFAVFVSTI